MNLRPTSQNVLLVAVPYIPSFQINIIIPEKYRPEIYEWRVVACGTSVPYDIQPGTRVILDPTSLAQRDFEYSGVKYKLAPFKEIQMLLGVAPEPGGE